MDTDDLYGLAFDEFVAQRGALAKALRAEKRRDEAAQVAALRKPSIAAWAVNQLVRTQRDAVRALFEAGDGLRGAQENLLAGRGDGRALRAAGERERAAVDTLVEAARGLLTSGGHELSAAVVERVDETLHAAALDEEARDQVRDGRLERELRHVGLGFGFGEALAATPAPRAKRGDAAPGATKAERGAGKAGAAEGGAKRGKADDGEAAAAKASAEERRAERERAATEREEAKRAERERAEARKAARAAETAARRRADTAARALEKAERRRDDAAEALRDADDALAAAREDAEEALAEHERAQAALDAI